MDSTAEVIPLQPRGDYHEQWKHHAIGFLIRSTHDYLVHIDKNGKLDWETTRSYDAEIAKRSPDECKRLNAVFGEICVAESQPIKGYGADVQHHYLKLLGEALVHWITGDVETCRTMVGAAVSYIRERSAETSRDWYLSASITSAGLFIIAGILAWIFRVPLIEIMGSQAFYAFLAACSGAVGAMFSVIARSGKLRFKASAGRKLHNLEASSRITAGAVSGLIMHLAIKSELVLSALTSGKGNMSLLLLASLAAGAGERLATSIISKFDDAGSEGSTAQISPTTEGK